MKKWATLILNYFSDPINQKYIARFRSGKFKKHISNYWGIIVAILVTITFLITQIETFENFIIGRFTPIELTRLQLNDESIDITFYNKRDEPILLTDAAFSGGNLNIESYEIWPKYQILPSTDFEILLPIKQGRFTRKLELMYELKPKSHSRINIHLTDNGEANLFTIFMINFQTSIKNDISTESMLIYRGINIKNGLSEGDTKSMNGLTLKDLHSKNYPKINENVSYNMKLMQYLDDQKFTKSPRATAIIEHNLK